MRQQIIGSEKPQNTKHKTQNTKHAVMQNPPFHGTILVSEPSVEGKEYWQGWHYGQKELKWESLLNDYNL